ncbi:hypothetical protein EDD21DRAFT_116752 [Dissophora ornata]|nr:hypothetical protein EDD21DRAFT_116752 [Dissophora ornata]
MSASSQSDKVPSSSPKAHQLISTAAAAAAGTDAGATFALVAAESNASAAPSSAAAVKAAMQARRKSRGLGEGLRPDFVFPKPQTPPSSAHPANGNGLHKDLKESVLAPSTVITFTSSSDTNTSNAVDTDKASSAPAFSDGENHRISVSLTNGSLAPPKNQQHLKTHYRTHSRNGSTVTVQDLKQAIAAVSTDLMDLPPLAVVSSNTDASAGSITPIAPGVPAASETRARSSHVFNSGASLPAISEVNSASVVLDAASEELADEISTTSTTPATSSPTQDSQPSVPEPADKSPGQGLAHLQLDSAWRASTLDSASAPSTPLRDTFSAPLLSPSVSSRPSSLVSGRTARDRSNVSVPPFFAYSIPHEFPSPYTSPRLLLPGAAGPTSLPISPFARKRKLAYHHTALYYPTSIISVKLPGQQQGITCAHRLPVGNVHDFEFYEYEHEEETTTEQPHSEQHSFGVAEKSMLAQDSTRPATRNTVVDKRMSWASMVSLDEDLSSKPPAIASPVPSQPYRPPNSRLRSAAEIKSSNGAATNGQRKSSVADTQRPLQLLSPTPDKEDTPASAAATGPLAPAAEIPNPMANSSSRPRKALPPPLNLAGNNSVEEKSTPGSPTTPTTPSRRRRSRSHRNRKDKSLDGTQQQDSDKEAADQLESAVLDETQQQDAAGSKQSGATDQPKKTRTRSRSRSRSRSRAHADNSSSQGSSNESVPPVPQTPSWVPTHNMTLASAGPPSANGAAPTSLSAPAPVVEPPSNVAPSHSAAVDPPMSPTAASAPRSPNMSTVVESDLKRRGPRPARLLSTRQNNNLQTLSEGGQAMFSPRSARDGPPDYFSMRPMHAPRTPMTPGGDFGDDDDDYYGRLQMVTTPMIQNGFFPNWAKGDAQLEELERIRSFLSARQYPDEMPLSDEW